MDRQVSDPRGQRRDGGHPAPHGQRSRGVKVVKNRNGKQEVILLTLAWLGLFVPLVWIAGPSYLIAFGILFACRVRNEERMMIEEFGDQYAAYMARTKRLVPGIW